MEQKEKTAREMQAEEQVRQAKARLNQIRREERAKTRKEQDHQKFILGGIVVKYFPEAYGFSVQEMCRILACAFKNRDFQNMIVTVIKDRKPRGALMYRMVGKSIREFGWHCLTLCRPHCGEKNPMRWNNHK